MPTKIRICLTSEDIMKTFSVMKQLRDVEKSSYLEVIKSLMKEGSQLASCFDESDHCVGVIGYNIGTRLHTGKMIYVADLVVDKKHRGKQHGRYLLDWIKTESKRLDCKAIILDSGVQRTSAHKFYFDNDFKITSFSFIYPCNG